MFVETDDKRFFLAEYLQQNPNGKFVIFVRTRVRAERVANALAKVNISALTIHGDKEQQDRSDVMKKFRANESRILIATDISARGIDINDVTHVINYDLPEKPENYVHRIGRTGRGMNKGVAVSFCSKEEKPLLEEIEKLIMKEIVVFNVSKTEYKTIIAVPPKKEMNFQELIEFEESLMQPRRKKKRKK